MHAAGLTAQNWRQNDPPEAQQPLWTSFLHLTIGPSVEMSFSVVNALQFPGASSGVQEGECDCVSPGSEPTPSLSAVVEVGGPWSASAGGGVSVRMAWGGRPESTQGVMDLSSLSHYSPGLQTLTSGLRQTSCRSQLGVTSVCFCQFSHLHIKNESTSLVCLL